MPVKKFYLHSRNRWSLHYASIGMTTHWKATSLLTPSPPTLPGAPHPRFPVEFRGFPELLRLSLKRAAHAVLSKAAYRKFGASRSFFARCGIPQASPSSLLRTSQLYRGAPRSPERTWAENDGRSPTAAFRSSIALTVLDHWLKEGAVFEEVYQTGSHMIDVVTHCSLGAFTVVCFKSLQDRQVGF
jgi:hypothetical protein